MVVAFAFRESTVNKSKNNYKYLRLGTGQKIDAEHWDKKAERPTVEFSIRDRLKLHQFLDNQELMMTQTIQMLIDSPFEWEITPERVKNAFLKRIGRSRTQLLKVSVIEDIEQFIATSKLKNLTTKNYYGLLHQLKDFERVKQQRYYWHEFNQRVFDEFLEFLACQKYQATTLWGFQKRLVACFNRAKKRELVSPSLYIDKRFKYKTPEKSYLNWEQVAAVLNYPCETEAFRETQIHFAVLALTGVRFSDLQQFYRNYEPGSAFGFSTFRVKKHPSPGILVPALLPVKRALKDSFPVVPSNPQLNLKLKALCASVLTYSVAKEITCHALRRSFITNFLSLSVVPEHVLAKLTGHALSQERRVFHGYNKISLFENAQVFVRLLSTVDTKQTGGLRLVEFVEQSLLN